MNSKYILLLINFLITIGYSIACNANNDNNADIDYQLDEIIRPSHYELEIKTYLLANSDQSDKQYSFDGIAKISLSTRRRGVDQIVLHAKGLNITNVELQGEERHNSEKIDILNFSKCDNFTNKILISIGSPLQQSKAYVLKFIYSGKIGKSSKNGFYLTHYLNEDSNLMKFASTQLFPNFARKLFPCFDEPKFKATFQLQVNRENEYKSNSNMKLANTIPLNRERSLDIFKTSPIMSTHQLAILISNFKSRNSKYGNFSLFLESNAFTQTEYAFEIGPIVLNALNQYMGMPYNYFVNMEKLDLIGVKDYNIWEAGENFGFIFFGEKQLIFDAENDNLFKKQDILTTVVNKMTGLWFGALVTPEWWNYSWLKDGLARYISYRIANEIHPEYELNKQFPIIFNQFAMKYDEIEGKHPLVSTTSENMFDFHYMFNDRLQYKSPAIIRMIAHMLGDETLRRTIQRYLRRNQYRTVTNEDLLKAINDEWNDPQIDIRTFLADWTEQPGYPLVTVNLSEDGYSMNVTQKRFFDTEANNNEEFQYTIPFTYTTNMENNFQNTIPRIYLEKNIEYQIELNHKADWVLGNIQQTGFYRVNYDENTWLNLTMTLKSENFGEIHEVNRAQIVDDIFSFAYIGLLEYKFVFETLEYLENEKNYLPWLVTRIELENIMKQLNNKETAQLRRYVLRIINNIYTELSFGSNNPYEKAFDVYLREEIRSFACKAGNPDCILNAKKVFDDFVFNKKPIPSHLQSLIFCTTVREQGKTYSNYLWDIYKFSEEFESDDEILVNLACTKDTKEFSKLLDFVFDKNKSESTVNEIFEAHENIDEIIDYVVNHVHLISNAIGMEDILKYLTNEIETEEQFNLFRKLMNDQSVDHLQAEKEIIFKRIEEKFLWRKKHFSSVSDYLGSTYSSATLLLLNFSFKLILIFVLHFII